MSKSCEKRTAFPPGLTQKDIHVNFRLVLLAAVIVAVLGLLYTHPDYAVSIGPALAMAISVKDVTASAKKFAQRGGMAGPDYQRGVQGAGQKWHDNTKAAADNF